jgi:ABC-2 type transport system ATP-binding protein
VDGNDIATHPEEAKKVLGYIPDEPSIWSHMTGEEFLYFTQALYNTEESGRDAAIQELLARFSLSGIEKTNFEDYSRGNKQKFSILAAFSHTPKLLLIDEPIVGLDPIGADIAKKMFKDFAQAGGAVLLVTHTLTVAEEISTNIGFLKDGKLVALGTLPELRTAAKQGEQATLEEVYKALAQ